MRLYCWIEETARLRPHQVSKVWVWEDGVPFGRVCWIAPGTPPFRSDHVERRGRGTFLLAGGQYELSGTSLDDICLKLLEHP